MVRLGDLTKLTPARNRSILSGLATTLLACGISEDSAVIAMFVPGRLEILGKHTDYAGGRSLTAAIERGIWLLAHPRLDSALSITSRRSNQHRHLDLLASNEVAAGDWALYPATVASRLNRDFPRHWRGADVVFESTLPAAAGLSSSTALIVAFYMILARINRLEVDATFDEMIKSEFDLAEYLAAVENGRPFGRFSASSGVGTFGGSEDHTAILCSMEGQVGQFSYAPVHLERRIVMPEGLIFAVASSGVEARKTGEARDLYNRLSFLTETACDIWRRATGGSEPHLAATLDGTRESLDRLQHVLRSSDHLESEIQDLIDRCAQFYEENETIVPAAGLALEKNDLETLGRLTAHSQDLAEKLLRNQIEETVCLVEAARELGAVASSAFGAGFGGSVWALISTEEAERFLSEWSDSYRSRFPELRKKCAFFSALPSGGASEIEFP